MSEVQHSILDQFTGLKFPRATILYLAWTGMLSAYLILNMAMDRDKSLNVCKMCCYSLLVIVCQQGFFLDHHMIHHMLLPRYLFYFMELMLSD